MSETALKILILMLALGANLVFRIENWNNPGIIYPPIATSLPVSK